MVDLGVVILGESGDCNSVSSHGDKLLLQRAASVEIGGPLSLYLYYFSIALFNVYGQPANSFPQLFVLIP